MAKYHRPLRGRREAHAFRRRVRRTEARHPLVVRPSSSRSVMPGASASSIALSAGFGDRGRHFQTGDLVGRLDPAGGRHHRRGVDEFGCRDELPQSDP